MTEKTAARLNIKKLFFEKRTHDTTSILKRATFAGAPMDAELAKSKWWLKLLKVSSFNHWLLKFKVGEAARINGRLKHKAGRLSLPPHPPQLIPVFHGSDATLRCLFLSLQLPAVCPSSVHPSTSTGQPSHLLSSHPLSSPVHAPIFFLSFTPNS